MMTDALVTIIGYIGTEPKVSQPNGKTLLTFGVAVNRRIDKRLVPLWFKVELWSPRPAQIASLHAGTYVRVLGAAFPDNWTDRNGVVHNAIVVRYPQVLVLGGEDRAEASDTPNF